MGDYAELAVRAELAERVVCTWVDTPRAERRAVLPDACIDLVWDGAQVIVAGPDTSAWSVDGDATYVGIRFRPGAAPGFLNVSAAELLDASVALRDLWGPAADALAERLFAAGTRAPSVLEDEVARRLACATEPDPVVAFVVEELRRSGRSGSAVVERLADRAGFSPRSLHRRCTTALGYGPKTLDRILRFRSAVRLLGSRVSLAETAWRTGYVDQAHLTNEFRRLGAATPRKVALGGRMALAANGV